MERTRWLSLSTPLLHHLSGLYLSVGKAFLVSRLQALLQSGRVRLPRTAEAQALADELLNYEIRISENANDQYGAFKTGLHDDLVTALGLAVLEDAVMTPSASYDYRAWRTIQKEPTAR